MTAAEITNAAFALTAEEQIELAQRLWVRSSADLLEPTPELLAMLDARLAEAEANPGAAIPWKVVHSRLTRQILDRRSG